MNKTEHYQLNQWESTNRIMREDFNSDNVKLEAALLAEEAARETLAETVASQGVTLAKRGNCKIYNTLYTGNGNYGVDHPNQISAPERILLVAISSPQGNTDGFVTWVGAMRSFHMTGSVQLITTFQNNGKGLSWYSPVGNQQQMNESGVTYYVTILTAAG